MLMSTNLLFRARNGDGDAFRQLTEPHYRELRVHCYRLLGSLEDAEDALQETLLASWQGLAGFEERASLRTWLYQIATRRCLNALRTSKRRPAKAWDISAVEPPDPSAESEVPWLEPYPDALLEPSSDEAPGPHARYERTEAISLAFVTALQVLPAQQRAVLILRDVLGYSAKEVATMLGGSVESANGALKRARATTQHRLPSVKRREASRAASPTQDALVEKFVRALHVGDVEALVSLLTADVRLSMPPFTLEYHGVDLVRRFFETVLAAGRRYELLPTRANGQLAFGSYLRRPDGGVRHGNGLVVLDVCDGRICEIVRFESSVLRWFGLPPSLI